MRICFIGTVDFSASVLKALLRMPEADVVAVITSESNTINSDFVDLSEIAAEHSIRVFKTNNVNSPKALEWVAESQPDIIFCFGWSRLIKRELLALPRLGVLGYHPAELPMNRGRHPLIWALALGLSQTASTFFFMDEGADSGDVLSQEIIPIEYEDDASSLYGRITQCALRQLDDLLPSLVDGSFQVQKQDEAKANTWRKRSKIDGLIDFRMPSRGIYNLVRALAAPYPGAHFVYRDQELIVWKAVEVPCSEVNIEPGRVVSVTNGIAIKCGINAIQIDAECFNGAPPKMGECIL